jgi:hypothetical protein
MPGEFFIGQGCKVGSAHLMGQKVTEAAEMLAAARIDLVARVATGSGRTTSR